MIHTSIIISVVAVANTSTSAYFFCEIAERKKGNPTKHFCHVHDPAITSRKGDKGITSAKIEKKVPKSLREEQV